jgi:hypothetical protein
LRPASANELCEMGDDPRPDFELDPITMEPCGSNALLRHNHPIEESYAEAHVSHRIGENAFLLRRRDGSQTAYNTSSLIDYILSSNDFTDPVTRIPYSLEDLAALDALAESTTLTRPSVLKAKQNPDVVKQHNDNFRREALTGLDRCAGESVSDMVSHASVGLTVRPVRLSQAKR